MGASTGSSTSILRNRHRRQCRRRRTRKRTNVSTASLHNKVLEPLRRFETLITYSHDWQLNDLSFSFRFSPFFLICFRSSFPRATLSLSSSQRVWTMLSLSVLCENGLSKAKTTATWRAAANEEFVAWFRTSLYV